MDKIYCYLLSFIFVAQLAQAQNAATPNPGFENWTQVGNHYDPDNWNTLNPVTGGIGIFTCTRATGADVHTGTYAIKLTTKLVFNITANGIASTATLITTPPYGVSGGIPYTQRPDSIVGWFKYTPASSADSGFAQFVLLDAANDTVGLAKYNTPNVPVTSFTRFSLPVTYFSSATPSLSYWILSSSNGSLPVVNSTIIFDDIDLVFNSSALNETYAVSAIEVYPDIFGGGYNIINNAGKHLLVQVYDQSGFIVKKLWLEDGSNPLHMETLRSGIYYFRVTDRNNEIVETGKLLKL